MEGSKRNPHVFEEKREINPDLSDSFLSHSGTQSISELSMDDVNFQIKSELESDANEATVIGRSSGSQQAISSPKSEHAHSDFTTLGKPLSSVNTSHLKQELMLETVDPDQVDSHDTKSDLKKVLASNILDVSEQNQAYPDEIKAIFPLFLDTKPSLIKTEPKEILNRSDTSVREKMTASTEALLDKIPNQDENDVKGVGDTAMTTTTTTTTKEPLEIENEMNILKKRNVEKTEELVDTTSKEHPDDFYDEAIFCTRYNGSNDIVDCLRPPEMCKRGQGERKPHNNFVCEKNFGLYDCTCQIHNRNNSKNREKRFECSYCHKYFRYHCDLKRHERRHSGARPFKCNICGKDFGDKGILKGHQMTHTGEKPFECKICGKKYRRKYDLKIHEFKHTGERPFKCQFCDKSFRGQTTLKSHEKTHTEKPFKCKYCGISYRSQKRCVMHELRHIDGDQVIIKNISIESFTCETCGKHFSNKWRLKKHYGMHSGEKPFQCMYCGTSYRSETTLIVHERTHTGEKPFRCEICGREFRDQGVLKRHKTFHTEEKPFLCKVCGKKFRYYDTLKNHDRTHSSERPYECLLCGKCFKMKCIIRDHMRIHTGEKPYKCKFCSKDFTCLSNLNKHIRIHTGERPFKCSICTKGFCAADDMRRHLKVCMRKKKVERKIC